MSERKDFREKYQGILCIFKKLVAEKRFSPVDRMARALNIDMVRLSLYEALRIAATEGWKMPSEDEVASFLDEAEKNLAIAQKLATLALTALSTSSQSEQTTAQTQ